MQVKKSNTKDLKTPKSKVLFTLRLAPSCGQLECVKTQRFSTLHSSCRHLQMDRRYRWFCCCCCCCCGCGCCCRRGCPRARCWNWSNCCWLILTPKTIPASETRIIRLPQLLNAKMSNHSNNHYLQSCR
jgi:hypothetical protein